MSMMRARVQGHRWVDHPAATVMKARVPGHRVDRPAAVVMEAREQGRCWIDHPAVVDQIASLKAKMVTNARESEERNKLLREERERMQSRFRAVKKEVNAVRAGEREKLTKLTLESNASLKELCRKKEKGEQILHVAQLCRKLETEEEKVVPFYASSLTPQEKEDVEAAILEPPSETLATVRLFCLIIYL
ncbi:hypothetical protein ACOMHN_014858 [Nucella lapillus]